MIINGKYDGRATLDLIQLIENSVAEYSFGNRDTLNNFQENALKHLRAGALPHIRVRDLLQSETGSGNSKFRRCENLIHLAAAGNLDELVVEMVKAGAEKTTIPGNHTVIGVLLDRAGHTDEATTLKTLKTLLELGFDPNEPTRVGYMSVPPAWLASSLNRIECVKMLVSYGAKIEAKFVMKDIHDGYFVTNSNHKHDAHRAYKEWSDETWHLLQHVLSDSREPPSVGRKAWLLKRFKTIDFLVKAAPLDVRPIMLTKGLCAVIRRGDQVIIDYLLDKHHADINGMGYTGETPLSCAARFDNPAILRSLLARPGIKIDQRGLNHDTPLHAAIKVGYIDSVKLIINAGASLDLPVYTKNQKWVPLKTFCGRVRNAEMKNFLRAVLAKSQLQALSRSAKSAARPRPQ